MSARQSRSDVAGPAGRGSGGLHVRGAWRGPGGQGVGPLAGGASGRAGPLRSEAARKAAGRPGLGPLFRACSRAVRSGRRLPAAPRGGRRCRRPLRGQLSPAGGADFPAGARRRRGPLRPVLLDTPPASIPLLASPQRLPPFLPPLSSVRTSSLAVSCGEPLARGTSHLRLPACSPGAPIPSPSRQFHAVSPARTATRRVLTRLLSIAEMAQPPGPSSRRLSFPPEHFSRHSALHPHSHFIQTSPAPSSPWLLTHTPQRSPLHACLLQIHPPRSARTATCNPCLAMPLGLRPPRLHGRPCLPFSTPCLPS